MILKLKNEVRFRVKENIKEVNIFPNTPHLTQVQSQKIRDKNNLNTIKNPSLYWRTRKN
jgi:hypothetical protein